MQVFYKIGALRNFAKNLGKHPCQSLSFDKVKKETATQVFSGEFCELFKNTFFKEHTHTTTSEDWCLCIFLGYFLQMAKHRVTWIYGTSEWRVTFPLILSINLTHCKYLIIPEIKSVILDLFRHFLIAQIQP